MDAKNLYGHSMMQLLPTKILDWVDPKGFNLDNYSKDGPIGCLLEVDLNHPDELHELHNAYPLPNEKVKVTKQMLSKIYFKS